MVSCTCLLTHLPGPNPLLLSTSDLTQLTFSAVLHPGLYAPYYPVGTPRPVLSSRIGVFMPAPPLPLREGFSISLWLWAGILLKASQLKCSITLAAALWTDHSIPTCL